MDRNPPDTAPTPEGSVLAAKLASLPDRTGVYLFKDSRGRVLYIGKAKSLRHRVRTYFHRGARLSPKTQRMVDQVADLEVLVTDTEMEALILEATLVKQHRPRFNVVLRDDKAYPYLRLSMQEPFPRLQVVRRVKPDGALYFGPYVPANAMWETLAFIKKVFPLATCNLPLDGKADRPCLEYQIGRCLAPCCDRVYRGGYREVAEQVRLFLQGRNRELVEGLKREMQEAADALAFEHAARLRDRIAKIERVLERQKVLSPTPEDLDVFALVREQDLACVQALFIRGGKLVGQREWMLHRTGGIPEEEVLAHTLEQFYAKAQLVPQEVLLPFPIAEADALAQWLSQRRGGDVRFAVPQRGRKRELVLMAQENARLALGTQAAARAPWTRVLEALRRELGLRQTPHRIEAFDISTIHGTEAVGSLVVWEDGGFRKSEYKRFRIRSVTGMDDFAMMAEVIRRHYRAVRERNGPLPELILVDGGRGQLQVALDVLDELGIRDPDTVGLAKERGERFERVYLPGRREPVPLEPTADTTHLLQRIRDEAHRFAVSYHRRLRGKRTLGSILDAIPGIGPARKQALLQHFGSLRRVQEATVAELAQVPGMTRRAAEALYGHLHGDAGT